MKKMALTAILIPVFLMSLTFFASAEWFDGDVAKVDLENQELTVIEIDPIMDVEDAEIISIISETTYVGIAGLKDIRVGDEISVEADYHKATDSWQAVSVEISGAGE